MTMKPPPYIYRIDLQTGRTGEVHRSDFTDEEITAANLVIEAAIAEGQTRPVLLDAARRDTWLIIANESTARTMHAMIWTGSEGQRSPALSFGLSLRAPQGRKGGGTSIKVYHELLQSELPTHPSVPENPHSPRLAVREEPAMRSAPSALIPTLTRYPSVLAWAWIDHHRGFKASAELSSR
jgi:hypothetical protein